MSLIMRYQADGRTDVSALADEIVAVDGCAQQTPASRWREKGEPDPHGTRYDCERAKTAGGHLTDDEVANAVYLDPSIANTTIAKDRIRWLSRKLAEALAEQATDSRLRQWREAILSKCRASDGFDRLPWPGDKSGWGFVHYFIGHLETRALEAEAELARLRSLATNDGAQS
ncbi:hypothetical protein [Bradyrhizobium sp. SRS-191]|uniref:hypothetical protein n=1 Tax=Bradyrhizobium sp. SRS-191 TaxID=2962606 RepID=UPI00211EB193|nr:hypothetical protein [Bradyrhizobium sp. SRS-191]